MVIEFYQRPNRSRESVRVLPMTVLFKRTRVQLLIETNIG